MSDNYSNLNFDEFGTFTPSVEQSVGVSGTPVFTSSYKRSGQNVTVEIYIQNWIVTSGTPVDIILGNLPYNLIPAPLNLMEGYANVSGGGPLLQFPWLVREEGTNPDECNITGNPGISGATIIDMIIHYLTEDFT